MAGGAPPAPPPPLEPELDELFDAVLDELEPPLPALTEVDVAEPDDEEVDVPEVELEVPAEPPHAAKAPTAARSPREAERRTSEVIRRGKPRSVPCGQRATSVRAASSPCDVRVANRGTCWAHGSGH